MPILFLKASGAPRKFANMPGYVKIKGHWVRANKETKIPAGAPKAAHPEAHAKGKQYEMPAEHAAKLMYPQEKAAANHEMKNFNEKHVPNLLSHAKEGDVTAILGHKYGTNTHAKKLVAIANHLLEQMGSTHKVSLGQQAGEHEGVVTHPKAKGEQPQAEAPKAAENAAEAVDTPAEKDVAKEAVTQVADAIQQPIEAPAPAPTAKGGLAMPEFMSGKQSKGVRTAYEGHAQKIMDAVEAKDITGLQELVNPSAGAWKGKTANSKMLLGLYAQALAKLQQKGQRVTPVTDEPSAVAAVETIVQSPAQPKPTAKVSPAEVTAIDWESYKTPEHIKSAKGYNTQLDAVKKAALAGDVYGILASKYGTNTYAKKVAAAANLALAKLGHPHLKVVLGKTAVHPMLEQLPQPSEAAKETQQQAQEVEAAKEKGPVDGETRIGKSGNVLVFKDGHWHKQDTDEPVADKEASPKYKAGMKVTPSQMLDLPAGTVVQCWTKDGKPFHKFLIGHSKAWFISPNGKVNKTPLGAGKYQSLMGLDQEEYMGYIGGYHAIDHPTTIEKPGEKGWMSDKMKAGLKVMYPGATVLSAPGIYPLFDGKLVLVCDLKNPTKGFAMDENGEWYIPQNIQNGWNDETYAKVMNGEDPGNDLAPKLGFAPDLEGHLEKPPLHPDYKINTLLSSANDAVLDGKWSLADHYIMDAAEKLKEQPGSEESMAAMKWLVQAKGKAHQGAQQHKVEVPDAPAPQAEPQKMTPLPEFENAQQFHEWSQTEAAQKWLDEGELHYGGDDAFSASPEAAAWDKWAGEHEAYLAQEKAKKDAEKAKAKAEKEAQLKVKPSLPDDFIPSATWTQVIGQLETAMETGDMQAVTDVIDCTEGLGGGSPAVNKYAKEVKAWMHNNLPIFTPAGMAAELNQISNLIKQRNKAIELAKIIGTPEAWETAVEFFKDKQMSTIALKVGAAGMAEMGIPSNLPQMPEFTEDVWKTEIYDLASAATYFDRKFAASYFNGMKTIYDEYTSPEGAKVKDYLANITAQITGKPKQQTDDQGDLMAQILAEGEKNKGEPGQPATEQGAKEGDMKPGKDGMLILKNGHWVKMGPDDIPQPTFSGPKAGTLNNAMTKLQAMLNEHGPEALKGLAKITEHKTGKKANGMTLQFAGGGKYFVFKHSEQSDYSSFANYLQSVKDWASKKPKKSKTTQAKAKSASVDPQGAATSNDAGSINYDELPDVASWTKIGGKKGSNEGESLEDEAGQKWYVKYPEDQQQAQAEVLAAAFYNTLGLKAQDAQLVMKNGKMGIASRWMDGLKQGSPAQLAAANGALDGFLVDVWLGNRDVVGMSYDNLQIDGDGDAVRVDAGASFMFRAQGAKKEFGNDPTELKTMLDPSVNSQTHSVFNGMTDADYMAAAAKLHDLPDAKIRIMVNAMGPGTKAERKALADTLIARKNALLAKWPMDKHGKPVQAMDPENLSVDPDRLPKRHDFENWNGPGSGLSSKAHLNKANNAVEQQIVELAATGNLVALKDFKFQPVDPSTGEPVGEKKPIAEYPSKHVAGYHADLVQILEEIANPPVALKIFHEIDVDSVEELDAAFPTKTFGTTVASVAAQEKMGFWVALGRMAKKDLEKVVPKNVMSYPSDAIAKAYDRYKHAGKLARAFINGIQASGSYNDLFRDGKEKDHHGNNLADVAKAALDFSTEQPAGTTITRWQNMSHDMVKKLLAAGDGTVFTTVGSMCCSHSPTATKSFGQHRLTIRYAEGARAVESFGSGDFPSEKEVTTLPGGRFMIIKKEMKQIEGKSGESLDIELLMLPPDLGL